MKKHSLSLLCMATILGCSSASFQTTTANISAEAAGQVIDGSTTKTDIITMFGEPNGFMPTAGSGSVDMMRMTKVNLGASSPYDRVMHYKNCIMKSSAQISGVFSVGAGMLEVCDTFTALLNSRDVVIAHSYIENNVINPDKLKTIKNNQSTRKDVIRTLGGPTNIVPSGNKEIYMYKNCVSKSSLNNIGIPIIGGLMGREAHTSRKNCQQASIVMNKSNGRVIKTNFIPFRKK